MSAVREYVSTWCGVAHPVSGYRCAKPQRHDGEHASHTGEWRWPNSTSTRRDRNDPMIILGLDPALGNLGWCLLIDGVVAGRRERIITNCGVISTKASKTAVERGKEIAKGLEHLLRVYKPDVVAYEAPSMPPNAGSAWKIGVAFGVIAAVLDRFKGETKSFAPAVVKRTVLSKAQQRTADARRKLKRNARSTVSKSQGKDQMAFAIRKRFPHFPWPSRKAEHEHVADAAGVVLAFLAAKDASVAD